MAAKAMATPRISMLRYGIADNYRKSLKKLSNYIG
jgi:hypothetical protein